MHVPHTTHAAQHKTHIIPHTTANVNNVRIFFNLLLLLLLSFFVVHFLLKFTLVLTRQCTVYMHTQLPSVFLSWSSVVSVLVISHWRALRMNGSRTIHGIRQQTVIFYHHGSVSLVDVAFLVTWRLGAQSLVLVPFTPSFFPVLFFFLPFFFSLSSCSSCSSCLVRFPFSSFSSFLFCHLIPSFFGSSTYQHETNIKQSTRIASDTAETLCQVNRENESRNVVVLRILDDHHIHAILRHVQSIWLPTWRPKCPHTRIVSSARISSSVTNNSDHVHHGSDYPSCKNTEAWVSKKNTHTETECKYNTSNDVFSRCKSVQKMATGKKWRSNHTAWQQVGTGNKLQVEIGTKMKLGPKVEN